PAGSTPELFAERLRAVKARGFRGAKTTLPLFYGASGEADSVDYSGIRGAIDGSLKETEYLPTATLDAIAAFFAAGRDAVGPGFELMLDCHGRLSPANAIRLSHALEPFGLFWLEEPIPPESAEDLARVRAASRVPIAAGERLSSIYEVRPFLLAGAVDFLQCDLVSCGGITGARKIAALAEAHYVPFAPHNPNGPIATAAAAQLLTAIPNASLLETVGSAVDDERFAAIVDEPLLASDGMISVGERPGLGLDILEGAVEKFPCEPRTAPR
ncbi:MAG: mandelate racemase/muconate lactonizing enzyme family protein, partial [Gaiellales bacterium]